MCGLVGAYSPSPLVETELSNLSKLLILSHYRGAHSTGWFSLAEPIGKNTVKMLYSKSTIHPVDLATNEWDDMLNVNFKDGRPNAMAFHTRFATKGAINKANSHPFNFSTIIGMHNGTFFSGLTHANDYETDSEALYHELNDIGIERFVKNDRHSGAMALVFFDKQKRTLNFYRNSQRPLHFLATSRCLYWASEGKDLISAVVKDAEYPNIPRLVLPFSDKLTAIEENKVFILPENVLVSIDITTCKYEWIMKKLERPASTYSVHETEYGVHSGQSYNWRKAVSHEDFSIALLKHLYDDKLKTKSFKMFSFEVKSVNIPTPIIDSSVVVSNNIERNSYTQWEFVASQFRESYSTAEMRYCVELDSFLSSWQFEQLLAFRKANPALFKAQLQAKFVKMHKIQRIRAAKLMGVTLNTLKQIVKGKRLFDFYVSAPWSHTSSGHLVKYANIANMLEEKLSRYRVENKSIPLLLITKAALNEATAANTEDKDDLQETNIIPFRQIPFYNDDLPAAMSDVFSSKQTHPTIFAIGPSGRLVTFEAYRDKLGEGCSTCMGGVPINEEIYWLDDHAFICEHCQETLTDPEKGIAMADALNCRPAEIQEIAEQISSRKLERLHKMKIKEIHTIN